MRVASVGNPYTSTPQALRGESTPPKSLRNSMIRLYHSFGGDHRAAHVGAESPQAFGKAFHHQVRSQPQRPLAEGRGKGVVNDHQHAILFLAAGIGLVRHPANGSNVNQLQGGIDGRLEI